MTPQDNRCNDCPTQSFLIIKRLLWTLIGIICALAVYTNNVSKANAELKSFVDKEAAVSKLQNEVFAGDVGELARTVEAQTLEVKELTKILNAFMLQQSQDGG
jgi:hypothetical protein